MDMKMKTLLLAISAVSSAVADEPVFVLAENGEIKADIVIRDDAGAAVEVAAEELQYHIRKSVGAAPEIVRKSAFDPSRRPYHFVIAADDKMAPEERHVYTRGNYLHLKGGDSDMPREQVLGYWGNKARGSLFAVYDFLENEMGVRWIWPGETGEYVPHRKTWKFRAIDRRGVEPLLIRWWSGCEGFLDENMWGFRNPANRAKFFAEQSKFLARQRVGRRIDQNSNHSFCDYLEKYGETHPDWFQLLPDGKRRNWTGGAGYDVSMCVSNPEFRKFIVSEWLKWYDPVREARRIPAPPWMCCCENDSPGACTCPNCRAWDAPDPRFAENDYWNGSGRDPLTAYGKFQRLSDVRWGESGEHQTALSVPPVSDRYAKFYNAVLAELKKSVPHAKVVGYAYANYVEAPKATKVDKDVVIEFVPPSCFPYDRIDSDFFRKQWSGWEKAGVRTFIYRPNITYAMGCFPVDYARLLLDDFAWAYDHGMVACSLDSLMGSWSAEAMLHYAITRAFRDPKRGYAKAREDMISAFGKARNVINEYFDYVERFTTGWTRESFGKVSRANKTTDGRECGGGVATQMTILGDFYSDRFFTDVYAIFDRAERAAADDPETLARISFLRKGIRNTELTRATRIAQKRGDKAAFDRAFREMNDYRASVEDECVNNFKRAARYERRSVEWPHEVIKVRSEEN